MHRKIAMKKDTNNFGRNVAYGIVICLLMMVVCVAIFAALIQSGTIAEGTSGYCVVCIHLVSMIIGASVALKGEREKELWNSLLLALVYCLVLIAITAMIFGGQYQGISETVFVILTGCTIPVIMGKCRSNVGKARRSRKRCC